MIRAHPPSRRQFFWCLALAMSMLAAQFAGQLHRINHARWINGPVLLQAQAKVDGTDRQWSGLADSTHSCLSLDAISLASGMASAIALLLPQADAAGIIDAFLRAPWHKPAGTPFQSRAPPHFR